MQIFHTNLTTTVSFQRPCKNTGWGLLASSNKVADWNQLNTPRLTLPLPFSYKSGGEPTVAAEHTKGLLLSQGVFCSF